MKYLTDISKAAEAEGVVHKGLLGNLRRAATTQLGIPINAEWQLNQQNEPKDNFFTLELQDGWPLDPTRSPKRLPNVYLSARHRGGDNWEFRLFTNYTIVGGVSGVTVHSAFHLQRLLKGIS